MPIRHTWPSSGTVRTVCRVGGNGGWAGILMGLFGAPLMRGARQLRRRRWRGRVVRKCILGEVGVGKGGLWEVEEMEGGDGGKEGFMDGVLECGMDFWGIAS